MSEYESRPEILEEIRLLFVSDPIKAEQKALTAVLAAEASNRLTDAFWILAELTFHATSKNESFMVLEYIRKLLQIAQTIGKKSFISKAYNIYGIFYMNKGDPLSAVAQFGEALSLNEEGDQPIQTAGIMANIGEMLVEMGDIPHAVPFLKESVDLFVKHMSEKDKNYYPDILLNLPYVWVFEGNIQQAWRDLVLAWKSSRSVVGWPHRARCHEMAGWICKERQQYHCAIRHYHHAFDMYSQKLDTFQMASILYTLGEVFISIDRVQEATESFRKSADICGTHGYTRIEIKSLRKLLVLASGAIEAAVVQKRLQLLVHESMKVDKAYHQNFVTVHSSVKKIIESRGMLEKALEKDLLTDLISYRNILERLEEYAQKGSFFFLFCDVDKLKQFNDLYGHSAGDFLLRLFARDLDGALPKEASAIRKSGDEFIVLLQGSERSTVDAFIQRLYVLLSKPHDFSDKQIQLSCSIGIAQWPSDTKDFDVLEEMADKAMYYSKAGGRNRASWYHQMSFL